MNVKFRDEERSRRTVLSTYDIVGTLIIALAVFSILFAYFFRVVGVDGDSMLPSLKNEDLLVLSLMETSYQRGDIVVVDRYTEKPLIKRVIAVGGETLTIDPDGNVFINGMQIKEKYIQGKTELRDFSGVMTIPRGYLFVMGDNRTVSKDSRSAEIGLVSVNDVIGKAIYCVWPIQSFGDV